MFQKIMPSSKGKTASASPYQEQDESESLRDRIFSQTEDSSASMGGIHAVNVMEEVVMQHLDETIEKFNCCRCDRCRSDIIALTLNELPSKYVVADADRIHEMAAKVSTKDVLAALVHAIIKVRANPRH